MKTSQLTGALLDYWVAKAEDYEASLFQGVLRISRRKGSLDLAELGFTPSTNWEQGDQIIEAYGIATWPQAAGGDGEFWCASIANKDGAAKHVGLGKTRLLAAMRAFVASKYGEDVPDLEGT